jgi:ketosteroid isomerase-like protein
VTFTQRGAAAGATCAGLCSGEITGVGLRPDALAQGRGAPFEGGTTPMADHPNAATIRAAAEKIERGDGDVMSLMDMLADDVVWHEIGRDEPIRGKQALIDRFQDMPEGAGIRTETHDIVANDEHTIQLVTATATMGDQELVYRTAEIYHMRDGKITERWAFSDDTDRINRFFGGT